MHPSQEWSKTGYDQQPRVGRFLSVGLGQFPNGASTLTVEGLRRGDIDRERFSELASLVGLTNSEQQALLGSVET